MKKKLPSLARTPSGLSKAVIKAIRDKGATVSGSSVKAAIEFNSENDDGSDGKAAESDDPAIQRALDLLMAVKSVEPEHVWWILEKRDIEAAQSAELGLDEEQARLEAATEQSADDARAYLRSRYVYGAFRDEVWDKRAKSWISNKALTNSELHRMPINPFTQNPCDPFDLLRRDEEADRVHNERFVPGEENEIVRLDNVDWLNTWTAPDIEPKECDASWMDDHILYLCNGDRTIADQMLDWMAFTAQNPGVKINYAPLLISPAQGVGKDTLGIALARIVGYDNAYFLDDGAIAEGRFDFMKSTSLVIVPEIMCGERREVANKLKPLITQERIRINEKNVKPYRVDNQANFMMLSNYENAAFIEDEDRRYFVIICRQKPKSPEYFTEFYGKIWGEEISAFAHVLLTRDLSEFNPKAPAPHTEHKDTVRQATQNGVEAWLDDAWNSNCAPFDRDVINLRDALKIAQDAGAPRQMSIQAIGAYLKKGHIGGGELGKPRIGPKGNQVRVYAVRNIQMLRAAPTDVIQRCYADGETFARAKMLFDNVEKEAAERRASK